LHEIGANSLDLDYNYQFLIQIHSSPVARPCQKFTCNNTNEVNMIYHPWVYQMYPFDMELNISSKLRMGLFSTYGINTCHLDITDGGITFDKLDERQVVIHNCAFSPANAQFQLMDDVDFCSFFSLAVTGPQHTFATKIISFHVIPRHDEQEVQLVEVINNSLTLRDLLTGISSVAPKIHNELISIISKIKDTNN